MNPMQIALRAGRDDFSETKSSSRSLTRLQKRNTRIQLSSTSCGCRAQTTSVTYVRWPAVLSRRVTNVHSPGCPHSAIGNAASDIDLRISICSTLLRRKVTLALGISRSLLKGFEVRAGLRAITIVEESFGAFGVIDKYCRDSYLLHRPGSWKETANELQRLFQEGEASPHDRLVRGHTLMHVSFSPRILVFCIYNHSDALLSPGIPEGHYRRRSLLFR